MNRVLKPDGFYKSFDGVFGKSPTYDAAEIFYDSFEGCSR